MIERDKINRAYQKGALELVHAPDGYEWGKETPKGADCSGVVSWALRCAGFQYRTTANVFAHRVFTLDLVNLSDFYSPFTPSALVVYDLTKIAKVTGVAGMRYVAIHIAPIIDNGLVVDADYLDDKIHVITVMDFIKEYYKAHYEIHAQCSDLTALLTHSGKWVEDLDPEWKSSL